jgi:hypothetical protein
MSSQNPYNLDGTQPIGQLDSLTVKALLVGIIAAVTSFGVKWAIDDAVLDKIVAGIGSLVTVLSMVVAWVGRLRATKVINTSVNPVVQQQTRDDNLTTAWAAVMLLPLMALGIGCSSTPPLVQVYTAKQVYAGSLDALTIAIQTGQITDKSTLQSIKDVRVELDAAFTDATAQAKTGGGLGFTFVMNRLNSALERFLLIAQQGRGVNPSSLKTELKWTPLRSSPSSSPVRNWSVLSLQPTRLPIPDSPCPTSNRSWWTTNWPLPKPVTTLL